MSLSDTPSIVCWLWNNGFRDYTPARVNMLYRAARYFSPQYRFVCVSDTKEGFEPGIKVVPMPRAAARLADLPAPQGKIFPSSYRRLWCFSEEAKKLGNRILMLDVDAMILGDLSPLFAIDADFVGWRPMSIWGREERIGGGTWALKTGTLTWLWEMFIANPQALIEETRSFGWNGSDQAILSRFLATKYPVWPQHGGIYGAQDGVFWWDLPPKDARVVHFNGIDKHWKVQKPWIQAYCKAFGD